MKKIIISFSFIITAIITNNYKAQVDQFTALESIGEGSVFKSFWGINSANGTTTGQAYSTQREIKFEKDIPERGDAFIMVNAGTDDVIINSGFGFLEANHLTKPSIIYNDSEGYVYINGLLYRIKGIKDVTNITSFSIENISVLMKPAKETSDLFGKVAMKEMKTRDHEAVLLKYFSDMKSIQETATANFTEDEKNKLIMREQAKKDKRAGIQAKNAAYWNSEEGQRVLAKSKQVEVTLVNDTQGSVYLCYGQGAYYDLKPGQQKTFSCSGGKVYRGTLRPNNSTQYDQTDNVLLDLNGNDCGRKVNASGVIR